MSSVSVIRRLLVADAALTAVVPSARIFAGDVPLGTGLPAIAIFDTSDVPRNTISMKEVKRKAFGRVQVTVYTATYPQKKAILKLVRQAARNQYGVVGSTMVLSVLPDIVGPDLDDDEAKIYTQSRDFKVTYIE